MGERELILTEEQAHTLEALITAIEGGGGIWTQIQQGMLEQDIKDPDQAFEDLRSAVLD